MIRNSIKKGHSANIPLLCLDKDIESGEAEGSPVPEEKVDNNKTLIIQRKASYLFSLIEKEIDDSKDLFQQTLKRATSFEAACDQQHNEIVVQDQPEDIKQLIKQTNEFTIENNELPLTKKHKPPHRKKAMRNRDQLL